MRHQIFRTIEFVVRASPDLYTAVRAGFVNQGTTLNKWCQANGLNRQTVEKALKGERASKRSLEIISRVVAAALPDIDKAA